MLARIVYHSQNCLGPHGTVDALNAIMDVANRNNERDGITGALLFDTRWFVQVLEGERETISATLRRIARDPAHAHMTVIEARTVRERSFANWWMGLALLRGDNTVLFERHGIGPHFDPRTMTGEQVIGLARDLAGPLFVRRVSASAA